MTHWPHIHTFLGNFGDVEWLYLVQYRPDKRQISVSSSDFVNLTLFIP